MNNDVGNCETCQVNKLRKIPVPTDSGTRGKDVLEIVHTDILGPIKPEAVDGHRYAIVFVDNFGRHQKVLFLKTGMDSKKNLANLCRYRKTRILGVRWCGRIQFEQDKAIMY